MAGRRGKARISIEEQELYRKLDGASEEITRALQRISHDAAFIEAVSHAYETAIEAGDARPDKIADILSKNSDAHCARDYRLALEENPELHEALVALIGEFLERLRQLDALNDSDSSNGE